ncbi:succinyl-diaminopimelate desuccinylase [Lachnospiraceae bacterium NK3A20]|nr:succinyl-diaminopimelate desuccinylase [Lachnospiraceae bacterium NK3A20]
MTYDEKKLNEHIEADRDAMVKSLQRLIRRDSVEAPSVVENGVEKPFGVKVASCLDEALSIAAELGFATHNMDYRCGWAEYGTGDEMILVLGHLDVVPEGEGWNDPPYAANVHDGKVWGRGAIDDKGPVTEAIYALKAIRDLAIPLKRRVRILFGCNEETLDLDMDYYKEHGGEIPVMGYTPDADYPLINGEKGICTEEYRKVLTVDADSESAGAGAWKLVSFDGGTAANITPREAVAVVQGEEGYDYPAAEKITVRQVPEHHGEVTITAEGLAAHGSMPERGENAVGRLLLYLAKLPLTGSAKAAITFLADKIGMECHGESLGIDLSDEVSGHLSMCMGMAHCDGGSFTVTLNYRYPVTCTADDCMPVVRKAFEEAGWEQIVSRHKEKLYVPESEALPTLLLDVYRRMTGDETAHAKAIGGGTYAKAIPNILAFGTLFPEDPVVEHLPNEFISIDQMVKNAKIQAAAIIALANH